ncbi:hypothetical protein AVEN_213932-1, partial [Araneus ventricosus]
NVNRPVSDSAEVDCASNNVTSGVANTRTVDPAPVAEDFNQIEEESIDSAPKAYSLSSSISQFQFLVNLFVLSRMLSTTHNLSEKLKENIDLSQAIGNVACVLDLLSKQRVNANDNFKTLYAQVKEIAAKLDIKEDIPRVCRLQTAPTTSLTAQKKNTIDELFMYLTLMIFVIH